MATPEAMQNRQIGLTKFFNAVLLGRRELKSLADGNRFIEALCAQEDPGKTVESLIAAPEGLSSIAKAFRFSGDSAFLNGPSADALLYLSHPSLKHLYNGQFLLRVLEQIVQPPTFWNIFIEAFHARKLDGRAYRAFAWLLLQLLSSRSDKTPNVQSFAEQITNDETFTTSHLPDLRNAGYKIKNLLDTTSYDITENGPGGRHDNDFADFRKVKILPTHDELISTEQPFYRSADAVASADTNQRSLTHLDNQFRLLREDLLSELRNDFQVAIGAKKGRRKDLLANLRFVGADFGDVKKRKPGSLVFRCDDEIPQLRNFTETASRKNYLLGNKGFLKHQSLGCLVNGADMIAFATIERDEEKLAKKPSEIVLHISDESFVKDVLVASKSLTSLQFVQIDTAVFAYEPVLRCLQNMTDVPLHEQLVDLAPGLTEALSDIHPAKICERIDLLKNFDLQSVLQTPKSVHLDDAQVKSLLAGLSKKVSLIQGPPGKFNAKFTFPCNSCYLFLTKIPDLSC